MVFYVFVNYLMLKPWLAHLADPFRSDNVVVEIPHEFFCANQIPIPQRTTVKNFIWRKETPIGIWIIMAKCSNYHVLV